MHNLMHPLPGSVYRCHLDPLEVVVTDNEYSCLPSPSPELSTCMCTKSFGPLGGGGNHMSLVTIMMDWLASSLIYNALSYTQ